MFSFFTTRRRSADPGSWEVVRPPRSLSKHAVPLLLCSDPDSSNRNILNWQRTHATTHRRLGGSDTSRRHAHLMSANDVHPSVFAESTRSWPLIGLWQTFAKVFPKVAVRSRKAESRAKVAWGAWAAQQRTPLEAYNQSYSTLTPYSPAEQSFQNREGHGTDRVTLDD